MSSRTVPANRPRPAGRITATHRELTVGSLIRAAADYETDAVAAVVRRSMAGNGVIRTWERLIQPIWRGLGGDRHPAGVPVAAERLFRRAMFEVLVAARPALRGPVRVLLACADTEQVTLPLDVLAAALSEAGVSACMLGAGMPAPAVAAAAGRLRPAAVVIWSQDGGTADTGQITSLVPAAPAVLAAGPGWAGVRPPGSVGVPTVRVALRTTTLVLDHPPT